jgi:predicted NACHT family NTPase
MRRYCRRRQGLEGQSSWNRVATHEATGEAAPTKHRADWMIPPRKVYIVGGPGSGKSTLAYQIAARIDAPVFDLDGVLWKTGGPKSEAERD